MNQLNLINLILTLEGCSTLTVTAQAGAGKTYGVMKAISEMPEGTNVFVAAPTHVAVEELSTKLMDGTLATVTFGTTAKLAGRYLYHNKQNGELENRFSDNSIDSYDLVIVDEIGATPAVDITRILKSGVPVVALGDREQLDAVKSKVADLWTDEWQNYTHRSFTYIELEGQYRASGPLYSFQQGCRNKVNTWLESFKGGRLFYSVADFENDFINTLAEAYQLGQPLDQYCMLAYRNSTVNRIQTELRQRVFGLDSLELGFANGEVIRCESAPGIATGRLATVQSTISVQDTVMAGQTVKSCKVHIKLSDGEERWLTAVHPMYLEDYRATMATLSDNRDWENYFALEEHFSLLVNANVMTIHKSQGRSIKHVWTHIADICSRRKLLYVAASRASQTLTGVWPTELWGWQKKLFGNTTVDQMEAKREAFTH